MTYYLAVHFKSTLNRKSTKLFIKAHEITNLRQLVKKLLLLTLLIGTLSLQSQFIVAAAVPEIIDHNPDFIDEFINPITLNWTVIDDNLRKHQIYQNGTLIDSANYTFNSQDLIKTSITLTFSLGNGNYEFTLQISDADNNTVEDRHELTKGPDPPEIRELSGFALPVSLVIIVVFRRKVHHLLPKL